MISAERLYAERDIMEQGQVYCDHVNAMTAEGLHAKSDIAAELAHRDLLLEAARTRIASLERDLERCNVSQDDLSVECQKLRAQGLSQEDREREYDKGNNDAWNDVIATCKQAWPEKERLFYSQSPTELIVDIINERDEAAEALKTKSAILDVITRCLNDADGTEDKLRAEISRLRRLGGQTT